MRPTYRLTLRCEVQKGRVEEGCVEDRKVTFVVQTLPQLLLLSLGL